MVTLLHTYYVIKVTEMDRAKQTHCWYSTVSAASVTTYLLT